MARNFNDYDYEDLQYCKRVCKQAVSMIDKVMYAFIDAGLTDNEHVTLARAEALFRDLYNEAEKACKNF